MRGEKFYLKGLLIEFVTPNLSQIYFSKSEISEKKKHFLNSCFCVVNSQRLFCSKNTEFNFVNTHSCLNYPCN